MDIETVDGCKLAASYFAAESPRGAVILVGAMGVPQKFYEPLARWLTASGFSTLTFDFRGMGKSRHGSLAKVHADILTWAKKDAAAALEALAERAPGLPITWIGHSLGGQILPFLANRNRIAKIVTIATGSGYWRENTQSLRKKAWLMWFGAVPVLTPLFGYFPGKRLGMVGDLPKGVIKQWRGWCLNPEYAVGVEPTARAQFAAITTPLTSLSFTDDEMMSEKNTSSIHGFYSGAPKTMRRFKPQDLGVKRVGHFGFFRPEMEEPLWRAQLFPELAQTSA